MRAGKGMGGKLIVAVSCWVLMQNRMRTTKAQDGASVNGAGLVLAIDTCGPSGSVALGRADGDVAEILAQIELEGRSYSATLVAAVGELLTQAGAAVKDLGAIVAVNGPGSFTGVRVGLSAVKGLAEPGRTRVLSVSRLEVLAQKAGVDSAALDAHRGEVYLRLGGMGGRGREMLAGGQELIGIEGALGCIAVCEEAAVELLSMVLPNASLVRTSAPTAADALMACAARLRAAEFVDVEHLDGHYLRRSDAEIFGDAAARQRA